MMNSVDIAISRIRSIGDEYCENQVYVFPDYDPVECDRTALCQRLGIPFTDDLMIRYPANRTFQPLSTTLIDDAERSLGVAIPDDYKVLLATFGEFHLPGNASICIDAPTAALATTRGAWCYEGTPLSALAISTFNETSDGNSIGYLRDGDRFLPVLFEFKHELRYEGDDPKLWTEKIADSLSDFLIAYLDRI